MALQETDTGVLGGPFGSSMRRQRQIFLFYNQPQPSILTLIERDTALLGSGGQAMRQIVSTQRYLNVFMRLRLPTDY